MRDFAVDPARVYVAGLSAGGPRPPSWGAYPDLYAAIGVHSGLACGAASDSPPPSPPCGRAWRPQRRSATRPRSMEPARVVPTIVFHGGSGHTVHPSNGDQVDRAVRGDTRAATAQDGAHGRVPGGHAYSRTLYNDASGRAMLEQWVIHGAGHAWSGGSPAGSFTDPTGPDASREMLRFFLEQPQHPAAADRSTQADLACDRGL